ncbi:hypothetical protein HGRIS_003529 [Hohenbuehelia grisea]|uniref:Metallo-beta-lactamase domain-containing protein n=1 Tax=Hohenbuehelia grisea TaxID=104357 RepID=A0ABR3JFL2_9AGAR
MALPPPSEDQAFCTVSALEAGHLNLPDHLFITNAEPNKITRAPSLSFLLTHSSRPDKIVFDLGIRRDWENYPPAAVRFLQRASFDVPQNVVESLEKGGLVPGDIDTVCISHCHWDHVGDAEPFANATFVLGGESQALIESGYPTNPDSFYSAHVVPLDRTRFLDERTPWTTLGPFPRALDFYGDGSLYVVDAPGHLPGHINVMARTSKDGGWVCLAADSAHHCKLLTGEAEIATGAHVFGPSGCAHEDKAGAEAQLGIIKSLRTDPRVRVVLAHDSTFEREHPEAFWPGKIASL